MSYGGQPPLYDDYLTTGVLWRRCWAWLIDVILIGLLMTGLALFLSLLGVLTIGIGFGLFVTLPFVPFVYHVWSLVGWNSATPGQRMCGLIVRRDEDLGRPTAIQAVVCVVLYYVTLATTGLLLIVALFTTRHRTLHDILSGLVVVRSGAWQSLTGAETPWDTPPHAYPANSYPPRTGP